MGIHSVELVVLVLPDSDGGTRRAGEALADSLSDHPGDRRTYRQPFSAWSPRGTESGRCVSFDPATAALFGGGHDTLAGFPLQPCQHCVACVRIGGLHGFWSGRGVAPDFAEFRLADGAGAGGGGFDDRCDRGHVDCATAGPSKAHHANSGRRESCQRCDGLAGARIHDCPARYRPHSHGRRGDWKTPCI